MWRRNISNGAESVWGKVLVATKQCLAVLRASEQQSLEDKRAAQKLLIKAAQPPNEKKQQHA